RDQQELVCNGEHGDSLSPPRGVRQAHVTPAFAGSIGASLESSSRPLPMSILLRRTVALGALLAAHAATAAPNTAVLAAAEACAPRARTLLERLVGIDSGTANVAGLNAMSAALTPELTRLGATVERVPS